MNYIKVEYGGRVKRISQVLLLITSSLSTFKMADERNFRSSYYEKVGCRGVEEKKSLEILMKEKPWDRVKLKQFCLRFTVPAAYRNLVWKVLLGRYLSLEHRLIKNKWFKLFLLALDM